MKVIVILNSSVAEKFRCHLVLHLEDQGNTVFQPFSVSMDGPVFDQILHARRAADADYAVVALDLDLSLKERFQRHFPDVEIVDPTQIEGGDAGILYFIKSQL